MGRKFLALKLKNIITLLLFKPKFGIMLVHKWEYYAHPGGSRA